MRKRNSRRIFVNPELGSPEWPVKKVLKGRDIDNGQLIMPTPELGSPEWPVRKVLKGRDIDNGQLIMPTPELGSPEWPVRKVLKGRDIENGQLIMPTLQVPDYILPQLERNSVKGGDDYLPIKVRDLDTLSEYKLSLWLNASGSYVLSGGWKSSFVMRRGLQVDDEVGFRCDQGKLHFTVLSPRPVHGLD